MFESTIGELEISESSILNYLVDLKAFRVTPRDLRLKLTEESIETLFDNGAIGVPLNIVPVQDKKPSEDSPVNVQTTKESCSRSNAYRASRNVIGELQLSDSLTLGKLVDSKAFRVTSSDLRLKLTEESIETLIESGVIGVPSSENCTESENLMKDDSVIAQPTKGSPTNSNPASETVVELLELSDLSSLDKLLNITDCRDTSKGLGLKLTEGSIKTLIESGAFGVPSNIDSFPFKNLLGNMNGILSGVNHPVNSSNAKRKCRSRNLKMPSDNKLNSVVEKKHQTRKQHEITSPSSSQSSAEPSKQEKQPVKSKVSLDVPVTRSTRNMGARRKRLAACQSSEDDGIHIKSPSKVSVNIDMVEIKSPVAQLQASSTTTTRSKQNSEGTTTDTSKVVTEDDLNGDTDDMKTTSESEPSDNSLKFVKKSKLPCKVNSSNASVKQNLTKIRTVALSSSEISEEDINFPHPEQSRTENIQSRCKNSNMESILQKYNMRPDVLAENVDISAFNCFWEKAGTDARLVVLRKQVLDRDKSWYSLAIVSD